MNDRELLKSGGTPKITRRRRRSPLIDLLGQTENGMKTEVMICGKDCQPGGENCNNYCNHDKSKPMADHPPAATQEMMIARAKRRAAKAIAEAEKACAEFAEVAKMQPQADNVTLRECLEVLQYATYHDGRYGQVHNYEKFQGPAQRLVKRIADRLGVKPYDGYGA